jgi:hypothetical protein
MVVWMGGPASQANVLWWELMGETLTMLVILVWGWLVFAQVTEGSIDTLLGPEGTHCDGGFALDLTMMPVDAGACYRGGVKILLRGAGWLVCVV